MPFDSENGTSANLTAEDFPAVRNSFWFFFSLFCLLIFAIPIEHRYEKLFRIYSLTLIPEGLSLPQFFERKIFFYISDLVVWLLFLWSTHKTRFFFKRESVFLVLFFVFCFTSILFSFLQNYPVIYCHFFQFLTAPLFFFFLAYGAMRREVLFKAFAWGSLATSSVQAIVALLQYILQHPLGLRLLNESPLTAKITIPNGRRFFFDCISDRIAATQEVFRSSGTLSHPNVLGGVLVVGLLFTTFMLWSCRKRRAVLSILYVLQLAALGTSFSRSAIFAYVLMTSFWFLLMNKMWSGSRLKGLFAIWISSILCVGALLGEQYLHRGGIINYPKCAAESDRERLRFQEIALQVIASHPLTGVGYGQFSLYAMRLNSQNTSLMAKGTVHNIFLLIAVEMGLPALVAFLIWIGYLIKRMWIMKKKTSEGALLLVIFLALLFIGCCDFYPITCQQGRLLFFGIAGLLARFSKKYDHLEGLVATQAIPN